MGFNKFLKQNKIIRKVGKSLKIYKEFLNDAHGFSSSYIEMAEGKKDYRYSILLLVHSIEKGMCMQMLRPFGAKKVKELMHMLMEYTGSHNDFEYRMGMSALFSWKQFYEKNGWQNQAAYNEVNSFLAKEKGPSLPVGNKEFSVDDFTDTEKKAFDKILFSRHSVRNFKLESLRNSDVQFAIKCFLEAPTACNRQMCKVYQIANQDIKEVLHDTIIGISGFNINTVNYFVITYDLAAFAYSGERQQGLFNAGLCTMNFINGLHSRGIGSCCLQWSNKHSEDLKIRAILKLADSERIAVVIAAGYYLVDNTIPASIRRDISDVFYKL